MLNNDNMNNTTVEDNQCALKESLKMLRTIRPLSSRGMTLPDAFKLLHQVTNIAFIYRFLPWFGLVRYRDLFEINDKNASIVTNDEVIQLWIPVQSIFLASVLDDLLRTMKSKVDPLT